MDKRAFEFVPNYKDADASVPYHPMTPKTKDDDRRTRLVRLDAVSCGRGLRRPCQPVTTQQTES